MINKQLDLQYHLRDRNKTLIRRAEDFYEAYGVATIDKNNTYSDAHKVYLELLEDAPILPKEELVMLSLQVIGTWAETVADKAIHAVNTAKAAVLYQRVINDALTNAIKALVYSILADDGYLAAFGGKSFDVGSDAVNCLEAALPEKWKIQLIKGDEDDVSIRLYDNSYVLDTEDRFIGDAISIDLFVFIPDEKRMMKTTQVRTSDLINTQKINSEIWRAKQNSSRFDIETLNDLCTNAVHTETSAKQAVTALKQNIQDAAREEFDGVPILIDFITECVTRTGDNPNED